jgi:hypothetical protein
MTSLADVASITSLAMVFSTAAVSAPLNTPDAAEQLALVSCAAAVSDVLGASVLSVVSITAASANKQRAISATHGAAAAAAAAAAATA